MADREEPGRVSGGGGSSLGRNRVDIVTNIMELEPQSFRADFDKWLGYGSAPTERLSLFLHEFTHHWCFLSPVGYALAATSLRIWRRTMMIINGGKDDELENLLLIDLLRYHTAIVFLSPLAEGLATFAEFDAVSKLRSKVRTPVMDLAGILFADVRAIAKAVENSVPANLAFDVETAEAISRLRRSAIALKRKTRVLLKPFATDPSGYFNGYLSVKSLWRSASRNDFRLANESDLFMMYLRSFIFDDLGLVRVLLAPATNCRTAAEDVINHLNQRVNAVADLREADIDAFEAGLLDREPGRGRSATATPGIPVSEIDVAAARGLVAGIEREICDRSGALHWLGVVSAQVLAQRQFMRLGCFEADIEVDAHGKVTISEGGALLRTLSARASSAEPRRERGEVTVVLSWSTYRLCRGITVSIGDDLIACEVIGPEDRQAAMRTALEEIFTPPGMLPKAAAAFGELTDAVVEDSWIRYDLEHVQGQCTTLVDQFYRDIALRFAFEDSSRRTGEAIDALALRLQNEGIAGVLGSSRTIRGAALLGMLCSLNPAVPALAEGFQAAGLDLDETLAAFRACHERHGFPPLPMEAGDCVFSTL